MKDNSPSLKDFNIEEDHEEWLNLTLSVGPSAQPPPPPPENTESYLPLPLPLPLPPPPPPSAMSVLRQLMPADSAMPDHQGGSLSWLLQHMASSSSQEPPEKKLCSVPMLYPTPPASSQMPELIPEVPLPSQLDQDNDEEDQPSPSAARHQVRPRKLPVQPLRPGKNPTIEPPYPWSTTSRAVVHSMEYLLSNGMNVITGEVHCGRCEKPFQIEYDLRQKFSEVAEFIRENRYEMRDRAPRQWTHPVLPNCRHCGEENCAKPVIDKKRMVNWLFLLLGQLLGCCKLKHLKYFCKHIQNHRTGAKDRVLYQTYLGLCKQLDPAGPFD